MSRKTDLRSRYLRMILDRRYRTSVRFLSELKRLVTFRRHDVKVFLQLDDPYSYLLSHYLHYASAHYDKARFRYYLCQALRHEYMPEPGMLAEYAVMDCTLLAREFGVPFLDKGETPVVEHRRALIDFLAYEHDEEDFNETFAQALAAYWRGDVEGVTKILGRVQTDREETNTLLARNQLALRKLGHYNCATMYYAGEWYWGVDRLRYLTDRLDRLRASRRKQPNAELGSLAQATQLHLPVAVPARSVTLPPLELFYSFRSPYSYLALRRAYEIADGYGLKLIVRPVLPMVARGLPVPKNKLLYIVKDANREAGRLGIPFGKLQDPLGKGVENCIAGLRYARSQNRERLYILAAGHAIFAEAVDVGEDQGMRLVAERAGLFWPEFCEALKDDSWRDEAEDNREAMTEAGVWGVPVFKLGGLALWGQDRDWLLSRQIEDLCHAGDGIMT